MGLTAGSFRCVSSVYILTGNQLHWMAEMLHFQFLNYKCLFYSVLVLLVISYQIIDVLLRCLSTDHITEEENFANIVLKLYQTFVFAFVYL